MTVQKYLDKECDTYFEKIKKATIKVRALE